MRGICPRATRYLLDGLFSLLAVLSAMLFVLMIIAWPRSYFATDFVLFQPKVDWVLHNYGIGWGKGYIAVRMGLANPPWTMRLERYTSAPGWLDGAVMSKDEVFCFAGLRVISSVGIRMIDVKAREVDVFMPCWLAAGLSACLPAIWWRRRRQRQLLQRRLAAGRCLHCGYDLRATPGRCPECGTFAPQLPSAPATSSPSR